MRNLYKIKTLHFIFSFIIFSSSCKKFVEVDVPKTDLISSTVFTSDATAHAAVAGIYNQMIAIGFASGDLTSLTYLTGLSSDELVFYSTSPSFQSTKEFYNNSLTPANPIISTNIWSEPYKYIYKANAIIEGLARSTNITSALKSELEGEAKFIRAFSHFYLVNLFGDIPLITTTDYRVNAAAPRTPEAEVYNQIIADLKQAQNLLSNDYSRFNGERVRPNKWAATALLSRVYLFNGDWVNAEIQATSLIDNTALFNLQPILNNVFLKNSKEAIWQLMPVYTIRNTWEAGTFKLTGTPTNSALRNQLVNSFETGDNRKINWIDSVRVGFNTFYYPYKYKVISGTNPLQEYSMILRLAEQFLIRSEARAQQNNIGGAQADLNVIRNRAGLAITSANDKVSLLTAVEHERQVELFTEWGHRWIDLKRTGRAVALLGPIKGTTWQTTDILYPIPQIQIQNDPSMANAQNPGY